MSNQLPPEILALLKDANALIPAIAQDAASGEILMLAYMNADRKSTRLNSSHTDISRMPSSA